MISWKFWGLCLHPRFWKASTHSVRKVYFHLFRTLSSCVSHFKHSSHCHPTPAVSSWMAEQCVSYCHTSERSCEGLRSVFTVCWWNKETLFWNREIIDGYFFQKLAVCGKKTLATVQWYLRPSIQIRHSKSRAPDIWSMSRKMCLI